MIKQRIKTILNLSSRYTLALFIIGVATIEPVKAQFRPAINGLFTPTQAQKFFEAGRRQFEQQERLFNNPDHWESDILQYDEELIEQLKLKKKTPNESRSRTNFDFQDRA